MFAHLYCLAQIDVFSLYHLQFVFRLFLFSDSERFVGFLLRPWALSSFLSTPSPRLQNLIFAYVRVSTSEERLVLALKKAQHLYLPRRCSPELFIFCRAFVVGLLFLVFLLLQFLEFASRHQGFQ